MCLERGSGLFVAMGGEVVEDHCGAGRDLGDQDLVHIGGKGGTVHCALDHPGCDQRIVRQPRDQGLRTPTAEGSIRLQPFTARGPSAQPGQVCLHSGFVEKDNAIRHLRDCWQPVCEPVVAPPPHLGAAAFGGDQRLFLCVKPRRFKR